jgi:hypothetical protein
MLLERVDRLARGRRGEADLEVRAVVRRDRGQWDVEAERGGCHAAREEPELPVDLRIGRVGDVLADRPAVQRDHRTGATRDRLRGVAVDDERGAVGGEAGDAEPRVRHKPGEALLVGRVRRWRCGNRRPAAGELPPRLGCERRESVAAEDAPGGAGQA